MMNRINSFMNDNCRWIVSASVFSVCACSYSSSATTVVVPLFVTAAIGSALTGKILKRVLNESRPAGAEDADPGMPSSHAVSLWSLAMAALTGIHALDGFETIGMLSVSSVFPANIESSFGAVDSSAGKGVLVIATSTLILGLASYWSYLRVQQGNHTPAQVFVGVVVGVCGGMLTFIGNYAFYAGSKHGGRVDDPDVVVDAVRFGINGVFLVATWGFAFRYVRKWIGRRRSRKCKRD